MNEPSRFVLAVLQCGFCLSIRTENEPIHEQSFSWRPGSLPRPAVEPVQVACQDRLWGAVVVLLRR